MRHLAVPLPLSPSPGAQNPRLGGGSTSSSTHPGGPRSLQKAPKTGQESPKRPPRRSKRAPSGRKIARRRPRWPPDSPRSLQDAPRCLPRWPQDAKIIDFQLVFNFCLAFSPFRLSRPKTAQKAPKTARGRPESAPRPKTQDGPRGAQEAPRRPKRPPICSPREPRDAKIIDFQLVFERFWHSRLFGFPTL